MYSVCEAVSSLGCVLQIRCQAKMGKVKRVETVLRGSNLFPSIRRSAASIESTMSKAVTCPATSSTARPHLLGYPAHTPFKPTTSPRYSTRLLTSALQARSHRRQETDTFRDPRKDVSPTSVLDRYLAGKDAQRRGKHSPSDLRNE